MYPWTKNPTLYEINTWIWLRDLGRKYQKSIRLQEVSSEEWDALASFGFDALWLMGVWERSPAGIAVARELLSLQPEYRKALPDYSVEDIVGSPYCVHRYVVDEHLGGPEGLAAARENLGRRGMRLILDFVPNHLAMDHPWVFEHPDYFIRGSDDDLGKSPDTFFEAGGRIFARGRDPYFPPWQDTAQLNAFHPGLRGALVETLSGIADLCDGVRVDMAMLLLDNVFEGTWGMRAGKKLDKEFWAEIIRTLKARHPEFLFLAEAYWGLEWELQLQGFDYCYDKRLYDRLVKEKAEAVEGHLLADLTYQGKLVRFIENHDEPRAASVFSPEKLRAAALAMASLPGAKLFHEGQLEGRKVRLPVQLGRRPDEPVDRDLFIFYGRLLEVTGTDLFRDGIWRLCDRSGWPDNGSFRNLLAWCWQHGEKRCLAVINFSGGESQGLIRLPWDDLDGCSWRLTDFFTGDVYVRDGQEMISPGLYVDLDPWGYHLLSFAGP